MFEKTQSHSSYMRHCINLTSLLPSGILLCKKKQKASLKLLQVIVIYSQSTKGIIANYNIPLPIIIKMFQWLKRNSTLALRPKKNILLDFYKWDTAYYSEQNF